MIVGPASQRAHAASSGRLRRGRLRVPFKAAEECLHARGLLDTLAWRAVRSYAQV